MYWPRIIAGKDRSLVNENFLMIQNNTTLVLTSIFPYVICTLKTIQRILFCWAHRPLRTEYTGMQWAIGTLLIQVCLSCRRPLPLNIHWRFRWRWWKPLEFIYLLFITCEKLVSLVYSASHYLFHYQWTREAIETFYAMFQPHRFQFD